MKDKKGTKDIYEFFNDMDIDLNDFKEAEVDELEKERVKQMVRESMAKSAEESGSSGGLEKRKRRTFVTVAAIAVMVAGLFRFGLAFPAYAKEVPVIGDIFRFLNGGRTGVYDLYTASTLDIGMVKEDNGIEVTLNQGVYDGRTLAFTYTIKTAEDFGERPYLDSDVNVDFASGITGREQLQRVGPGVYVGQSSYTFFGEKEQGERKDISFLWRVSGITRMDENARMEENGTTVCRLNYSVSLKALDYKAVDIAENQERTQNMAISLNRLSATPINTIMYYTEETPHNLSNAVQIEWKIKDDLGNVYAYEENGGHGKANGEMIKMENVLTFNRLDPKAKTLFITPTLKLVHTQGGGVSIDENVKETVLPYEGLPEGTDAGEWTLKQVVVDISAVK